MNVAPSFSPPISLMKPYFLLSGFFYLLSMFALLFLTPITPLQDLSLIAWVHLYILGFAMMSIFASMAQLGPIVVETAHYNITIFKYLWIFLCTGVLILLYGFLYDVAYLLTGGTVVLIAMLIYSIEFLLTLKNAQRKTSITLAMKMSNFFLLTGIIIGLVMASTFTGTIQLNPQNILPIHIFGLVVGFIILLIMGISIILIPMFGSSKRISDNEFKNSFYTISFGVITMMFSPFFYTFYLQSIAYCITAIAILLYFYQLYKMTNSRARVKHDIWAKSMYVAFISFILSFFLLINSLFSDNEFSLRLGMWLMFIGFFGSIIIGNFYKILPFLVWFHIYSPLIEERTVPMLHQLLPTRLANLQWFYSLNGLLLTTVALSTQSRQLFTGGVVLLATASLIFFIIIIKLLRVKI